VNSLKQKGWYKIMISLCMIVKNEEQNLSRCLGSVKGKVDEIVIVDTGSTDNTKEIAKEYTDKIFDFEWCDDFAAARNFSINMAENDWVLILDADEVVNFFNKKNVNKFIAENEKVVGRIKRINTFEDTNGKRRLFERVNRLFDRKHFKYEAIIHEQVVAINGENYDTVDIEITADHVGYEKEVINRTNKFNRNKELLKKAINLKNNDPYLYFQLGKTFFVEKIYEEAEVNFENAIELGVFTKFEYVQDLIESYGYTLINLKKYDKAMILKKYEEVYKNRPDFNFVMGLIYMNNAMFQEAVNKFIQCQNNKDCKIEGVNSYLSNYNIGVIYECVGMLNEAEKYYKKCGNYELALKRLSVIT
jgi:glycosyltransferase involved in cell wall biosynthesis